MKHRYLIGVTTMLVVGSLMFGGAVAVAYEGDSLENDNTTTTTVSNSDREEKRRARAAQITVRAEEARVEQRAKIDAKKLEIREKLDEKRRAVCEQHETKINDIITRAKERAINYVDRLTSIEDRAVEFALDKNISVDNLADLRESSLTAKALSLGSIEAIDNTVFDCDSEGAQREFGVAVRDSLSGLKDTLSQYRDSVKDVASAIRHANGLLRTEESNTVDEEQ